MNPISSATFTAARPHAPRTSRPVEPGSHRATDARPIRPDVASDRAPLQRAERPAKAERTARRVAKPRHHEPAQRSEERSATRPKRHLRKHLARLDRQVRKRLKNLAESTDLNPDRLKELARGFHHAIREAYQSARQSDSGPFPVRTAVRDALSALRTDLRALTAPRAAETPEEILSPVEPPIAAEPAGQPVEVDPVPTTEPVVADPRAELRTAIANLAQRLESLAFELEDLLAERSDRRGALHTFEEIRALVHAHDAAHEVDAVG